MGDIGQSCRHPNVWPDEMRALDAELRDDVVQESSRSPKSLDQEAVYIWDSCGEEIVVPVDISAGEHQDYAEDSPVCCHPMTLHVDTGPDGEAHIDGEHE
jgi:hypothetical protein